MSSGLTIVAMLALTLGAAVYVAWPLLVGRTRPEEFFGTEPAEPVLQRLTFQRDTTYGAMKELEFDFAMGNLSEQDYQQLQERYKRKAVAILKQIDEAMAGRLPARGAPEEDDDFEVESAPPVERRRPRGEQRSIELDVEQEIEAFRRRSRDETRSAPAVSPIQPTSRPSGGAAPACPSCGRPVRDPEALFCSKCGAPLRPRVERWSPGHPSKNRRKGSGGVKGD